MKISERRQLKNFICLFLKNDTEILSDISLQLPLHLEDQAINLLHHHFLAPKAYRLLNQQTCLNHLSKKSQESLLRGYLYSVQIHKLYEDTIKRFDSIFKTKNIKAIAVKGPLLARRYYKHPEDRPFSDLDLVFQPEDKINVLKILEDNDFALAGPTPRFNANTHKIDLINKKNPLLKVECHFGLGHGPYQLKGFWDKIESNDYFYKLNIFDEYIFLLYHGFIQHRLQKFGWLLDLIQIQKTKKPDLKILHKMATNLHMEPAFNISQHWITNQNGNKNLDRWLELIASGDIEHHPLLLAGLRAEIYGSWSKLFSYAFQRQTAHF